MGTVLLSGATLIDGRGGPPVENAWVLIDGDKVREVGAMEERPAPCDARRIDLSGRWLLPGLIDAHMHVFHSGLVKTPGPDAYNALVGARTIRENLMAGVTTVRDTGTVNRITFALRRGVEEGLITGSRVVACGPIVCQTGGHGVGDPGSAREADGEADVRRAVREQWTAGSDFVKVTLNGAPNILEWTPQELAAAVDEAHRLRLRVAAHASILAATRAAALAGVDIMEHGCDIDAEAAEAMAVQGIYLVPTAVAYHVLWDYREHFPAEYNKATEMRLAGHERSVRLALRSGVRIAAGTDIVLPYRTLAPLVDELEILASWGLSRMQAIEAATRVAAEVCGRADHIGTVESGKLADLIAVDADPLTDLSALRSVSMVMQGGRLIQGQ